MSGYDLNKKPPSSQQFLYARIRELVADRDRLAEIVERMVKDAPSVSCENMHHAKADRHGFNEECPVVRRWHKAIEAAQAAREAGEDER